MSENQATQGQDVIEQDWLTKALGVVQSERQKLEEVEGRIRKRLTTALGPGGSRSVYDPQHLGKKDRKGWKATATEMAYQASVEDRSKAQEWVLAKYPEKAEHRIRISPEVPPREVLNVIRRHAKHMLEEVVEVPDYVLNELVQKAASAGQPIGFGGEVGESAPPGIKVTQPDSYLSVKFYDAAGDIITSLRADERYALHTIVAAMAGDE